MTVKTKCARADCNCVPADGKNTEVRPALMQRA